MVDVPSLLALPNIFSTKLRLINPSEIYDIKEVLMVIVDENLLFIYTHNQQSIFMYPRFGLADIQRLAICPNLPMAAIELNKETEPKLRRNYIVFET